jgi:hypothetical protein
MTELRLKDLGLHLCPVGEGGDYNVPMVWWLEEKEGQRKRRRKVEEKFN